MEAVSDQELLRDVTSGVICSTLCAGPLHPHRLPKFESFSGGLT
jgi:hypothetical protein